MTSNELLVPVGLGTGPVPVAVIVKLPAFVMVTFCVRTPSVNALLVSGAPVSAPVEVRITLLPPPSNAVTVLPNESLAVMVMAKATFCVFGPMIGSKTNWATGPAVTVKTLLSAEVRPVELVAVNCLSVPGTSILKFV